MTISFISAFYHGSNPKRCYDEYKRHFDCIVDLGIPIVLFLDERSTWTFPANVRVYKVCLEDTWVGKHITYTSNLPTIRSEPDTCEYMKIINAKTEWLYRASLENPFQTEWFVWIDFGLPHVFKTPIQTLERLKCLQVPDYPCIRTAGIWSKIPISTNGVHWRFAGGFLMAHISKLYTLHLAVISKLAHIQPAITWEVNIWAMLEEDGLDFGWFLSDHDDTIIPSNV